MCLEKAQKEGFFISFLCAAKILALTAPRMQQGPRYRKTIQSNRCKYFSGRLRVLWCQLLHAECVHTMKSQTLGL